MTPHSNNITRNIMQPSKSPQLAEVANDVEGEELLTVISICLNDLICLVYKGPEVLVVSIY